MVRSSIVIAGITVFFGFTAPVIPEEMQFMYAGQGLYTAQFEVDQYCEATSSSTPCEMKTRAKTVPTFDDKDNNGLISYAVFADKKGERVYIQIPDNQYKKMGEKSGFLHNPKRNEYLTLFESLTKPNTAEAAIAFYSASGAQDNGGTVTSLTFTNGVTSTTTDPFLMVTAGSNTQNAPTVTGVTWDGTAMTEVNEVQIVDGLDEVTLAIYAINAPATGILNVVATWSSDAEGGGNQLNAIAQSYSGAAQTGQPDSNGSASNVDTTIDPYVVSTTVVAANSWLAGGLQANAGEMINGSGVAPDVQRDVDRFNQVGVDSNGTVGTGSQSLDWDWSGVTDSIVALVISIAPVAEPAAAIDNTTFDILN